MLGIYAPLFTSPSGNSCILSLTINRSKIFRFTSGWMALVCFAGCRLTFIKTGKQLALKIIDNNPYTHQGFYIRYLVSFTC